MARPIRELLRAVLPVPYTLPAGRPPAVEAYRLEEASALRELCLSRLGLSRSQVWASDIDCLHFHRRSGNAVLAGARLDRLRDCYQGRVSLRPEELAALAVRLGYHCNGTWRRTFRTVVLPAELLEQVREGPCLVLRCAHRSYRCGGGAVWSPALTGGVRATPAESRYTRTLPARSAGE